MRVTPARILLAFAIIGATEITVAHVVVPALAETVAAVPGYDIATSAAGHIVSLLVLALLLLRYERRQAEAMALHARERDRAMAAELASIRIRADADRLFSRIVTASPLAIALVDSKHTVRAWNPAAEQLFGWTAAEMLGARLPADPAGTQGPDNDELVTRALEQGSAFQLLLRRPNRAGEAVTVDATVVPLVEPGGEPLVLLMGRDVGAELEGRARVARTAARLHGLHELDAAIIERRPLAAVATLGLGHLREMIGAERAMLAFVNEAGTHLDPFALEGDGRPHGTAVAGAAAVGSLPLSDLPFPPDDPRTVVVEDLDAHRGSAVPYLDQLLDAGNRSTMVVPLRHDGRLAGLLALAAREPDIFRDDAIAIAEEVGQQLVLASRAERDRAALADREARLSAILDGSPNPILTVAPDGRIRYANPATATVFGGTLGEIIGREVHHLVRPIASPNPDPAIAFLATTDPASMPARHPLEVDAHRLDGSVFPVEAHLAPLVTPEGTHAIVTVVDLSERAELEARLQQADRLEVLGRFAGILAHDVRNHLAAVRWSADLLAGSMNADDPHREDVAIIQGAVADSLAMTTSVLEYARPSPAGPAAVDVAGHLDQLSGMLARVLGPDVVTGIDCPSGLAAAAMPASALSQVLLNLATNARDAMPHGGRFTIEVEPLRVDAATRRRGDLPAGGYVRFRVADTGSGMDAATAEHAFEPFFTTKAGAAGARGTGLGLASVFLLVTRSGGRVDFRSTPGLGTTFTFEIPVVTGSPALAVQV